MRETPLVVILLVMGILVVSAVRNGLGCLARVNELIAAIVVAAVLILLSLIAKELDISSLQPVLAAGFLPLLRSAAVPIAWYGEVVVLLYIIPHLQKRNGELLLSWLFCWFLQPFSPFPPWLPSCFSDLTGLPAWLSPSYPWPAWLE